MSLGFPRQENCSGLPFPSLEESSQPRDRTHLSCTGRQILSHWAIREAPPTHVSKLSSGLPWWLSGEVCLPVQETWVQSPVWEDLTCHRATKPGCHNHWACVLEPISCNSWAHAQQLLKPMSPWAGLHDKRSHHCNERVAPAHQNQDTSQNKKKLSSKKTWFCTISIS